MIKKLVFAGLFAVAFCSNHAAQTPTPTIAPEATVLQPAPTPIALETVLAEAEKQTAVYQETFRDLLAVETKTFEEYDRSGALEDKTVVESNFFVYQSAKAADRSTELRNVTKVDEKAIPDSQARADRFLSELQKSKTVEKELEEIQDEGLRYDKTYRISGLTLFEAIVLADNLRPAFDFRLSGTENYQGREVYVVAYRQTKKTPFIAINERESRERGIKTAIELSVPGDLKKSDKFLRGRLLIDRENFQVWREERQVVVQSANGSSAPLVAQETVFEYAPSEFGILVPKKITFTDNRLRRPSKGDEYAAIKNAVVTFDYSKFRKTDVDVKIVDEEQ